MRRIKVTPEGKIQAAKECAEGKYGSELRVEVEMSNVDRYLELLDWFGIQKLGELITMFRSNEEIIVELIREGVNQYGLDIVTMNMIFRNLCIAELINSRYPNSKIRKFVELLQPKGLDNDKLVADIINKKEKHCKQRFSI